jgi:hypothetical protein
MLEKQGMHNLLSSLNEATSQPTIVKDPHNTEKLEDRLHLYPTSKSRDSFDRNLNP